MMLQLMLSSDFEFLAVALVIMLLILAAVWAARQYRLSHWPMVTGRVDEVSVRELAGEAPIPGGADEGIWSVVIDYIYDVNGEEYRDQHTLGFRNYKEAQDYARRFQQGMKLQVHYSPWRKRRTVVPLPGQDWLAEDEGPAPNGADHVR